MSQPRLPLAPDSLALSLYVAAAALVEVREGRALNDGLASLWKAYPQLEAGGRGAVQDMLYGCLRDYGRADVMFATLLRQPLSEPHIDALLRVALHRLEVRPELAHTIVDQAVEAAAWIARGGLKGLVNGVLRSALRQWPTLLAACEANEVAHWRHPDWWIAAIKRAHPEHWQAALQAANGRAPMSLRVNRRRSSLAEQGARLAVAGAEYTELGAWAMRLHAPMPVASLPGYAEGWVSVQDWGAQQAAQLLDLRDGQRVLDACAAPGGKTAHILEAADVELLALDSEPARAQRIEALLSRLGLAASIKVGDARTPNVWWDGRQFERILADVPCSASGVVRRHADIKWLRREADVVKFATVQRQILNALWPLLAPGGKMLYLTCSVFPEENQLQVARFAQTHADCLRVARSDGSLDRQLLPGPEHDGFFFALLEKQL